MRKSLFAGVAALCLLAGAAQAQIGPYTFRPNSLAIDSGTKTATAVSGAVTLNKGAGVITTEALTTAAAATYTLTITDSAIAATDTVFASVWFGTSNAGTPEVTTVTPGAGSVVIIIRNAAGAAALNGTLKIGFHTLKN
jgi:hypothetical protein